MKHILLCVIVLFVSGTELCAQYNMSNNSVTDVSGALFDSGGGSGNYGSSENFTFTICPAGGAACIGLQFTEFATEAGFDELSIFDGNSTAGTPLGTYSGTNSPGLVYAASGCVTLQFTSDGSFTDAGWKMTWEVLSACPVTENISNGSSTACLGVLNDSGGSTGNYGTSENFTYNICPSDPVNSCVNMTFATFDLENNFDVLSIYNGPDTTYPLIGDYTGTTSPGFVQSTVGCLTLVFTSDGSVTAPGFTASWECVACPVDCSAQVCTGGPAPANDICTGAISLGALPTPNPCTGGNGLGAPINTTGSNLCATAADPYVSVINCQGGGDMASPALDVWYEFEVTGNQLDIDITNAMTNTSLGLWQDTGLGCGNLQAAGCANGSSGIVAATFGPLNPGTYYLQISGADLTDECDFDIQLQNNNNCDVCLTETAFDVSPPPTDGSYGPGQTVSFCYTVSEYNQTNVNWLHGVVPELGPGWDPSTLIPVAPATCTSGGTWSWYNSTITGTANGVSAGPGFFYETASGGPGLDGNPGNNFGDANVGSGCELEFCWTVATTTACVDGEDLSLTVATYSDSETGSWGSFACADDPDPTSFAVLECCDLPTIDPIADYSICDGDGPQTITATNPMFVDNYEWSTGDSGPAVTSITVTPTSTTTYSVTISNGCSNFVEDVTITVEPNADATWTPPAAVCAEGGTIVLSPDSDFSGTWFGNGISDQGDGTAIFDPTGLGPTEFITYAAGNAPCDDVFFGNIVIESHPPAPTATGYDPCQFEVLHDESATGSGGDFNWYNSDPTIGSPTPIVTGPDFTVADQEAQGLDNTTVGSSITVWVTESSLNGCEGPPTELTFTVVALPEVTTATLEGCDDGTGTAEFDLTLVENTVNNGSGNAVTWYTDAALLSPIFPVEYDNYVTGSTTVYALVTNATPDACTASVEVVLTVIPLPVATPTTLAECDDGTGQGTFDLTSANNTVNGGTTNTVDWYSDDLYTILITDPTAYVSSGGTVYPIINGASGTCTNETEVILNVIPAAAPVTATIEECDDGTGQAVFDLTTMDATVNGGTTDPVTWYSDAALTSTISTPAAYTSGAATVYAEAVVSGCVVSGEITLSLTPPPAPTTATIEECDDGSGVAVFDLTTVEATVIGGTGAGLAWFEDAALTTAITTPAAFSSSGGSVYAELTGTSAQACTASVDVTLTLLPQPPVSTATLSQCDDGTGNAEFDLTSLEATVNGGSGDPIVWFTDAALTATVPDPAAYTSGGGSVYAQVTSSAAGACTNDIEVTLTIDPLPPVTTATIDECDDGTGVAEFDLSSVNETVNGGTGEAVAWYEDAALTTIISSPTAFTSSGGSVYAQVTNATTTCVNDVEVTLNVLPLPSPVTTTIEECDDGTGNAVFDLTSVDATVNGGTTDAVVWFENATLTITVPDPTNYTSSGGTVYAEVTSGTASNCAASVEVTLSLLPPPAISTATLDLCDDGTGVAIFDLTSLDATVNGGSGDPVVWFTDAALTATVPDPTAFSSGSTSVYAQLTSSAAGACTNDIEVVLTVLALPPVTTIGIDECDDGSGTAIFDLTAVEDGVNGGSGDPVAWFEDAALTTAITTPATFSSTGQQVFAEVTDLNNCVSSAIVTLNITPAPPANTTSIDACDDGSGTASFDLTAVEATVVGAVASTVVWAEDAAGTTLIANPNAFVSSGGVVYALLTDPFFSACTNTAEVTLTLIAPPTATIATPDPVCNDATIDVGSFLDLSTLITAGDAGGTWTDDSGAAAAGASITFPTLDFDGVTAGNFSFTYTTASATAPCAEQDYTITVAVEDCSCPSVAVAPAPPFCTDFTEYDLAISTVTTEAGTWSIDVAPPGSDPATIVANIFIGTDADPGTYELIYTLDATVPAGCPQSSEPISIVLAAPADAGEDATVVVCEDGAVPMNLYDELSITDLSGVWSVAGSSSVIPVPGAFNAVVGVFDPTDQPPGSLTFAYTLAGTDPCPDDEALVTVEIEAAPFALLLPPPTVCNTTSGGSTVDLSTLIIDGDFGGSWVDDATGSPVASTNLDFDGFTAGNYTFSYTTNSAATVCTDQTYTMTIVVEDCNCPEVTLDLIPALCNQATGFDLADFFTSSDVGVWALTDEPTGSNPITLTGTSVNITDADPGTYTFTFILSDPAPDGCEVVFTNTFELIGTPNATWGAPPVLCTDGLIANFADFFSPSTTPGGTFTLADGTVLAELDPGALGAGTFDITYTVGPADCQDLLTNTVTIGESGVADFTPPAAMCDDAPAFPLNDLLNLSATTNGTWDIDGTAADTFDPAALGAGAYFVTYTAGDAFCGDTQTDLIQVLASPTADFTVVSPICLDGSSTSTIEYTGTAPISADFDWNFNGGTPAAVTGPGPHEISWDTPGDKTITLQVDLDGCLSEVNTQTVTVDSPMGDIIINCTTTTNDITFTWNELPEATGYIVTVDGTEVTPDGNSYLVDGLVPGDMSTITVEALSPNSCPNVTATNTCTAQDCPTPTIVIDPVSDICLTETGSFDLVVTVTDGAGTGVGEWSGPGIIDPANGTFSPDDAGLGSHTVIYTFTEEGCEFTQNTTINIFAIPTADFTLPTELCTADGNVTATYTGTAGADATYNWDFAGATVVSGADAGPYELSFPTAGDYTVTLSVTENACTSAEVANTIAVSEPLATPVLTCGTSTTESVTFNWEAVDGATEYELNYSIMGGAITTETTTDLTLLVDGLSVGDEVTLEVIAIGPPPCGNSDPAQVTCIAEDCPDVTVVISNSEEELCADVVAFPLLATPEGGTWSGSPAIVGDTFDPALADLGANVLTYTYIDAASDCEYSNTHTITVNAVPVASFTLSAGDLCADGTTELNVTFDGTAGADATYAWDFAGGINSGTDTAPILVFDGGTGEVNISLTVTENDCVSEPFSLAVNLFEPLLTPVVNCIESTTESVTFEWAAIVGAESYDISYTINAGAATADNTTDTNFMVDGLSVGDEVNITVIALSSGACGNSDPGTADCTALDCPTVDVVIDQAEVEFCADVTAFTLVATPVGGTFSGTGVTGDTFDPAAADLGANLITYTYTDAATDCEYSNSISITVFEVPVADIAIDLTDICIDGSSEAVVTFTGTAIATATYAWDFDGGDVAPGTGEGPHNISWTTAGTKTITLTVTQNGCVSNEASTTIEVFEPLTTPLVNCTGSTTSSVDFEWGAVDGATDYEVTYTVNGVDPVTETTSDTNLSVTGLAINDLVDISVIALGPPPCGNSEPGIADCTALDCPDITPTITGADAAYCIDVTPIVLVLDPVGGTLSGDGVTGTDTFDPALAGVGTHILTYDYTDVASDCDYTTSISIDVFAVPTADFTIADTDLCIDGSTTTIEYTGTASGAATYTWDFDGGTATPGTGQGPHDVSWDTEGVKTVTLTVSENGCTSTEVTQTISIEMPLEAPVVNCVSSTLESVSFEWTMNWGSMTPGEFEWTYTLPDGTTVTDIGAATDLTVDGLSLGDEVNLSVVALNTGICGNSPAGTADCVALDCPDLTLTITGLVPSYCEGTAAVTLAATPTGGAFTIDGDPATVFDPSSLAVGTYTIVYTYTDDVGCIYTEQVQIDVTPQPVATFTATPEIVCVDDLITVSFTGTASATATLNWDFGSAGTQTGEGPFDISYNTAGTETILLTIVDGDCSDSFSSSVQISSMVVNTIADQTVLIGADVILTTEAVSGLSGAITYEWEGGAIDGSTEQSPTVSPAETTTYTVTATDEYGCIATDEVTVNILLPNTVLIPNAFSPNGDGVNDTFHPTGINIVSVDMAIYDRWGVRTYEIVNGQTTDGWDGSYMKNNKIAELGVYVFYGTITFADGVQVPIKGNVLLTR